MDLGGRSWGAHVIKTLGNLRLEDLWVDLGRVSKDTVGLVKDRYREFNKMRVYRELRPDSITHYCFNNVHDLVPRYKPVCPHLYREAVCQEILYEPVDTSKKVAGKQDCPSLKGIAVLGATSEIPSDVIELPTTQMDTSHMFFTVFLFLDKEKEPVVSPLVDSDATGVFADWGFA
ncbi:hypothetical protein NDU88_000383 [Pleurodeles waltl]|uniref:Uncharacterized protein n=1 Tax=Pleurodeles waltl TaxID=8319 RepID=A0AAV7S5X4_PLEWA|nr:hypothetical protein NDU88_000383 [Pleurodeles waltl]